MCCVAAVATSAAGGAAAHVVVVLVVNVILVVMIVKERGCNGQRVQQEEVAALACGCSAGGKGTELCTVDICTAYSTTAVCCVLCTAATAVLLQVKMEAGSAPEVLDALNRKITTLQTEEAQLASRAGEESTTGSSTSSFMASLARARGTTDK